MNKAGEIAGHFETLFNAILENEMAGLPLLNEKLGVETVGFQDFEGRCIGILITPWLMSLVMLPSVDDQWNGFEVGDQHFYEFPSGEYKFRVNEFDGIGVCQMLAIHSPMSRFSSGDQARIIAHGFMKKLLTPVDPQDRLDEKRMERFIDGEDMAHIRSSEQRAQEGAAGVDLPRKDEASPVQIARSDFIRGRFKGASRI
jgi:[NiFe] hydrogenase assembly HybE family chaperone